MKDFEKIKKTFKKHLTSGKQCDIIVKLPTRRGSEIGHWKLNNKRKVQALGHGNMSVCARTELDDSERNTTQTKSKEQSSSDKDLGSPSGGFRYKYSRVWSWLRMNAGGVHNTFKSNGVVVLDPFGETKLQLSGGRVSNAWATCPCVGDNVWKRTLIPHNVFGLHELNTKDLLRKDGLASD